MLDALLLVPVYCFQDYDALCRLIVNGSSLVLSYTLIHGRILIKNLNFYHLYVIFYAHVVTSNLLEIIYTSVFAVISKCKSCFSSISTCYWVIFYLRRTLRKNFAIRNQ